MRKTTALIAGTVGYVLGARAGRERYEQLRSSFERLRSNPKVQQTAHTAAEKAKGAAPVVKDKLGGSGDSASSPTSSSGSSSNSVNLGGTSSTATSGDPTVGGTDPGESPFRQD